MSSFQISYIYELIDKITPSINKIQGNIDNSATKIKSSAERISEAFDKIGTKLDKLGTKSVDLGKKLFLKTTLPITLMGRSFINAASDYQESLNKVDVAFGKSSESVKKFATAAGKNFGIDRGRALDMAAMFGDMATGMGMSQERAAMLGTSLTGLAGDLASFKNINLERTIASLSGVFTGETEALKHLGIVMTQANLQQFALTRGIHKKVEKMKQAELVMLRYNYVVAMSKNSVGDFMRTQTGYANQTRILTSRWRDLSIVLGSILLPYAIKFVNVLISLVEKFTALNPITQKAILIIAGLVAIVSPLLIVFGMAAKSIAAVMVAIRLLAAESLILAGGFRAIGAILAANPLGVLITVSALVFTYWKDIVGWIEKAINYISNISLDGITNKLKEMVGFKSPISVAATSEQNITQTSSQKINAGGQLDIFLNGQNSTGAKTNFTPAPNNFMNVGVNSIYAGAR